MEVVICMQREEGNGTRKGQDAKDAQWLVK